MTRRQSSAARGRRCGGRGPGCALLLMLLVVAVLAAGLIGFPAVSRPASSSRSPTNIRSALPVVATAPVVGTGAGNPEADRGRVRRAPSTVPTSSAEVGGVVDEIGILNRGRRSPREPMLLRLRPNDDEAKLQQLQASADLAAVTLQRDQKQLAGAWRMAQSDGGQRCGQPQGCPCAGGGAASRHGGERRSMRAVRWAAWACARSILGSTSRRGR